MQIADRHLRGVAWCRLHPDGIGRFEHTLDVGAALNHKLVLEIFQRPHLPDDAILVFDAVEVVDNLLLDVDEGVGRLA